jgi:hypothetical protein
MILMQTYAMTEIATAGQGKDTSLLEQSGRVRGIVESGDRSAFYCSKLYCAFR